VLVFATCAVCTDGISFELSANIQFSQKTSAEGQELTICSQILNCPFTMCSDKTLNYD